MKIFGEELRRIRAQREMSQEELGLLIGTQKASVQALERGRWRPSTKVLKRLSDALDYSFEGCSFKRIRTRKSYPMLGRKLTMKAQSQEVRAFAEMLRRKRKEMGFTTYTLADELDVCRQTISTWENGTTIPRVTVMPKLADLFKFNPKDYGLEPIREEYALRANTSWRKHKPTQWDNLIGQETPNNISLIKGSQ